jgi:hypothetical protein
MGAVSFTHYFVKVLIYQEREIISDKTVESQTWLRPRTVPALCNSYFHYTTHELICIQQQGDGRMQEGKETSGRGEGANSLRLFFEPSCFIS